jgi:integrase
MGAALPTYLPIKRANLRPRSYVEVERHLLRDYKALHARPLRQIATAQLSARYERIAAESGPTAATNAWRSLHAFLDWCLRQGLIDRNPAIGVERRKGRSRDRVLAAPEIKVLWECTGDGSDYCAILRLLLLTACRAGEIGGLRWSEIFADRIVLPAERVKNGRQHTIPLTPTMRAILDGRPRRPGKDFVFGRADDRPFAGWSTRKAALDERMRAAGVTTPWVTHDLRRSAASMMAELGIQPATIEAALNHASGFRRGVAGVYNRFDYAEPVRLALEAWDRRVAEIVAGRAPDDHVIPLRA